MVDSMLYILLFLVFVMLEGLFAGTETGMYRLSRVRLRLGIEKKKLGFVSLGKVMENTRVFLLSTLTGTNLAGYFATSTVTILLLSAMGSEHRAELSASVITAPVLFVFSELIPKNIFYYRADALMPKVAGVLLVFHKLFRYSGIVPVLNKLSRVFDRFSGLRSPAQPRGASAHQAHIGVIIRHSREEGILSPTQTEILGRLSVLSSTSIRAVMTALSKVWTVDISSGREELRNILEKCPFTRLPVRAGQNGKIAGFVNIYEALCSAEAFSDLRGFVKPIRTLPGETTVSEAISVMQSEKLRIVLVTGAGRVSEEKPVGIITMKDLAEEFLGELAEW